MSELDRLWNGWRAGYVTGASSEAPGAPDEPDEADEPGDGSGSVFTRILASGLPDTETNIVFRGRTCFAIMNAFPYGTGHTLVMPMREAAELESLEPDEIAELWSTVTDAVRAVRDACRPDGVNVGINLGAAAGGSVREHLHVHVVPRWTGDGNFMTSVANARTLPEPLVDTAAKIRSAWPGSIGTADD